jgi:hypothetical protein
MISKIKMDDLESIFDSRNKLAKAKGYFDWKDLIDNASEYVIKMCEEEIRMENYTPDSGYDDFDA